MSTTFRLLSFFGTTLCVCIFSCQQPEIKRGPDVSGIEVPLVLHRFEQDVFAVDTNRLPEEMARLQTLYPELFPLFTQTLIRDVSNPTETPEQAIRAFLRAPLAKAVYDTVQVVYGNLSDLEPPIKSILQHYRFYFPTKPVPQVATLVTEFAVDAFTYGDSLCGLGLDMFLGPDYPYYNPEVYPEYLRRQFTKTFIPVRLARVMAQNRNDAPSGKRLLDIMVHNGKTLYIAACLSPETPDSLLMGYTRTQWEGCTANEPQVWARLLDLNLLYETDYAKFRKLVEPSPNAPMLFTEAPGEIGNWMGLQIVRAYMLRHPDTSLDQLLAMQDAQQLLEASRYKPKRQ
jgi:hypothetical protein